MTATTFGQPSGAICQIAYTVADLDEAMEHWASLLQTGPWLVMDAFSPASQSYRGSPTDLDVSIATAYNGSMMIELIQQNDDLPSVYRESIDRVGYGFHHVARTTEHFDTEHASYRQRGFSPAFEVVMPSFLSGGRVCYFDTTSALPGMIELIELNPHVNEFFSTIKRLHDEWDGFSLRAQAPTAPTPTGELQPGGAP